MAIAAAEALGGEVLSVDSMQVYRGLDIGTAKPTALDRARVAHHMIDLVDPAEEYSVAEFRMAAREIIAGEGPPLVIAGGSGLHFRAVVDPMTFAPTDPRLREELETRELDDLVAELETADPGARLHVDLANPRRVVRAVEIMRLTGETPSRRARSAEAADLRRFVPELDFTAVGVDPGGRLTERIRSRLASMRRGGLTDEVAALRGRLGRTARLAVGYRELLSHLANEIDEDEAYAMIRSRTSRLASKQRTWFRKDPRIRWLPWADDPDARLQRLLQVAG